MAWEGHTAWFDIGTGTHLRFVKSRNAPEPSPLPSEIGCRIGIETGGARMVATIIEPDGKGELRLELDDGTVMRLTRATGDDRIEHVEVGVLGFQDWIVREIA